MTKKTGRQPGLLLASLVFAACAACSACSPATSAGAKPLTPRAELGRKLFFDTKLSASGSQSCGTCHVPAQAFAASDGLAVSLGGPNMDLPGFRNAPSLMYLSFTPSFHFEPDGTPVGGFFTDGRAASLADQARGPFVSPFEMANANAAELLQRLLTRPYLQQFKDVFGAAVLDDPAVALQRISEAIAAFESEEVALFQPFSSKFDYWRKGRAQLTAQELNGLRAFNDVHKGNCAACHPSTPTEPHTPPLFTDFTYDSLGLPRNAAIAANSDSAAPAYTPHNSDDAVHTYYDLGLCGPQREAVAGRSDLCGAFKVPTLRNVAVTAPYFHNGSFATLKDALAFYVRRDTNPEEFYPVVAGGVDKFNDLPAQYQSSVNTGEVPYNRQLGEAPALSEQETADVIAFLCTLTDGFDPERPDAQSLPAQCSP